MLGITPFESVIVFFFSSLILALPEGLCTSPPHLSPHEKYLKKRISAPPWHVYPFPSTVPPIPAHSFDIKKNARDYPIRKCGCVFFQQPYPGAPRRAVHITSTPVPTREVFEKKDFGTSPWLIISTMAVSDLQK